MINKQKIKTQSHKTEKRGLPAYRAKRLDTFPHTVGSDQCWVPLLAMLNQRQAAIEEVWGLS